MRFISIICAAALLSGCTGNLKELKERNPEANDFAGALAAEYLAYADSEAEMGHASAAERFAGKGLDALSGENVAPDSPDSSQAALLKAQEALLAVLTDDMKRVSPQKVARAQLLFDCWVEQSKTLPEAEATCADEFQFTMSDLQPISETFLLGQQAVLVVIFPDHSAELDATSRLSIGELASGASKLGKYTITVEAFAESGLGALHLAQKRLDAVKAILLSGRVPKANIKTVRHDENKAVSLSEDDSQQNRNNVRITTKVFGQ